MVEAGIVFTECLPGQAEGNAVFTLAKGESRRILARCCPLGLPRMEQQAFPVKHYSMLGAYANATES